MQVSDIELYLADLGQELQQLGLQDPIRVLVVGGAYMLLQLHNRAMTNDIDVLLQDIENTTLNPLYDTFQSAVRAVASRHYLPNNWMNDVIGDALRNNGNVPQGTLWRNYGMLAVYMPPPDYILALKLFAGRARDRDDIAALCRQLSVTTRQQAQEIVDHYISNRQLQLLNGVDDTLADLFP